MLFWKDQDKIYSQNDKKEAEARIIKLSIYAIGGTILLLLTIAFGFSLYAMSSVNKLKEDPTWKDLHPSTYLTGDALEAKVSHMVRCDNAVESAWFEFAKKSDVKKFIFEEYHNCREFGSLPVEECSNYAIKVAKSGFKSGYVKVANNLDEVERSIQEIESNRAEALIEAGCDSNSVGR